MKQSGLTIIEIVSVLAIMTILAGLMLPSFSSFHARSTATAGINWIVGAVNFARYTAINRRVTTTLCPSSGPGMRCKGNWHDGMILFADHNADARINGSDYVIERINNLNFSGTLKWRAFRNRQYLQMTQFGYTNYQNGNFVYCPEDKNLKFARQIVINVQGRARMVHTRNSDGLMVDRRGKLLRC